MWSKVQAPEGNSNQYPDSIEHSQAETRQFHISIYIILIKTSNTRIIFVTSCVATYVITMFHEYAAIHVLT
eukprot:g46450.t1